MSIEIAIRSAALDDETFLVKGNAAMAHETEHRALDQNLLRRGVRAVLENPSRGVYYIAESAGQRVGQMMITYEWSDWRNANFWWIQSVYVVPEFRRQGVFRALYSYLENQARGDAQVCGLRLYVERENARAQAVYGQCGLEHAGYQMFERDFVLGRK